MHHSDEFLYSDERDATAFAHTGAFSVSFWKSPNHEFMQSSKVATANERIGDDTSYTSAGDEPNATATNTTHYDTTANVEAVADAASSTSWLRKKLL